MKKIIWHKFHLTLKIGIILLILGTSPILIVLLFDSLGVIDAGNAVGPGVLLFLTFYPSLILIIIGSILTYRKRKNVLLQ